MLPPLAVQLTQAFQTQPDVTGGIFLVAACPIGGISNTYSYLARASTALSVTLTGLSCLCASLTIPLISKGLELAVDRSLAFAAPIPLLAGQFVLMLIAPVSIGIWVRRHWPLLAERYRPVLRRLAIAGICIVLLLVIASNPNEFLARLPGTVPVAAVFVVISMLAGWMVASLVTADSKDRFTIAAEFGTRNVSIATAIAVTMLGRVEFAYFGAAYFITEVPLMLLAIAMFRRREILPQRA
jgi:BASS family bile acid:Na+ symporter